MCALKKTYNIAAEYDRQRIDDLCSQLADLKAEVEQLREPVVAALKAVNEPDKD